MISRRLVFLGLCAIGLASANYPDQNSEAAFHLFKVWQVQFDKTYSHEKELMARYEIFLKNMKTINALNALPKTTSDPAVYGLTRFSDLTLSEFKSTVLMPPRVPQKKNPLKMRNYNKTLKAPDTFDWTSKSGVVTSVKDQGQVGTCWAFAGVGNLEGLYAIKTDKSAPSLSPQSLNDCDGLSDYKTGALACGPLGGLMPGVYVFVQQEGGIMTEDDYPYCMGYGSCMPCQPDDYNRVVCGQSWPIAPCYKEDSCDAKYDKSKFLPDLKVKDYIEFDIDEDALLERLVEIGPLAAGIDATDLQFYRSGILTPVLCDPAFLNHAVVLVGYDSTGDTKYWRAKNSWGTSWGEQGYFRIARGQGTCGINYDVSSAVLE